MGGRATGAGRGTRPSAGEEGARAGEVRGRRRGEVWTDASAVEGARGAGAGAGVENGGVGSESSRPCERRGRKGVDASSSSVPTVCTADSAVATLSLLTPISRTPALGVDNRAGRCDDDDATELPLPTGEGRAPALAPFLPLPRRVRPSSDDAGGTVKPALGSGDLVPLAAGPSSSSASSVRRSLPLADTEPLRARPRAPAVAAPTAEPMRSSPLMMAAEVDATHAGEGRSSEKAAALATGRPAVTSLRGPRAGADDDDDVAEEEPAPPLVVLFGASSVAAASWAWRMRLIWCWLGRRESLGAEGRRLLGASV